MTGPPANYQLPNTNYKSPPPDFAPHPMNTVPATSLRLRPILFASLALALTFAPAAFTADVSAQAADKGGKQKKAGGIDWNEKAAPWGKLKSAPPGGHMKSPFKIFDNIYYVG